jgi:hypothetical protein
VTRRFCTASYGRQARATRWVLNVGEGETVGMCLPAGDGNRMWLGY